MSNKVWFITGASGGMGAHLAKAAMAAGHAVVASGRDADPVSRALGQSNDLLAVKLDVTSRADAMATAEQKIADLRAEMVRLRAGRSRSRCYFKKLYQDPAQHTRRQLQLFPRDTRLQFLEPVEQHSEFMDLRLNSVLHEQEPLAVGKQCVGVSPCAAVGCRWRKRSLERRARLGGMRS